MATRYPSDYDNRSRVEPGISRSSRGGASTRTGSSRAGSSGQRGASTRRAPSGYSSQRRPQQAQRPAYSGQRQPQRGSQPRRNGGGRRRRPNNRFPVFIALAAVLVLALVLIIAKPFGRSTKDPVTDVPAVPASNPVTQVQNLQNAPDGGEDDAPAAEYDNLADKLADAD